MKKRILSMFMVVALIVMSFGSSSFAATEEGVTGEEEVVITPVRSYRAFAYIVMTNSGAYTIRDTIGYGYTTSGTSVKIMQSSLSKNGFPVTADGIFGANTQAQLKSFQASRNLTADGVCGNETWRQLLSNLSGYVFPY